MTQYSGLYAPIETKWVRCAPNAPGLPFMHAFFSQNWDGTPAPTGWNGEQGKVKTWISPETLTGWGYLPGCQQVNQNWREGVPTGGVFPVLTAGCQALCCYQISCECQGVITPQIMWLTFNAPFSGDGLSSIQVMMTRQADCSYHGHYNGGLFSDYIWMDCTMYWVDNNPLNCVIQINGLYTAFIPFVEVIRGSIANCAGCPVFIWFDPFPSSVFAGNTSVAITLGCASSSSSNSSSSSSKSSISSSSSRSSSSSSSSRSSSSSSVSSSSYSSSSSSQSCTALTTQTFNTSTTWFVPTGVEWVQIQAWGAGGGGGSDTEQAGGGGGGGGGFAQSTINIPNGTTSYSITIGQGGAGGTLSGQDGANGGNTIFGTNVVIGVGGVGGQSAEDGGAGGAGGTGSTGAITFHGGTGGSIVGGGGAAAGTNTNGQNGFSRAGAGGTGSAGGGSGGNGSNTGNPGIVPGGGGGGAFSVNGITTFAGGNGAGGRIILTYCYASSSSSSSSSRSSSSSSRSSSSSSSLSSSSSSSLSSSSSSSSISSSSSSGIAMTCSCGSALVNSSLTITFTNVSSCSCLNGVSATLTYAAGTWSGSTTACSNTLNITLTQSSCAVFITCGSTFAVGSVSSQCSPFQLSCSAATWAFSQCGTCNGTFSWIVA
jgi:hypothetical protein